MQIQPDTPTRTRRIGNREINYKIEVPLPYSPGPTTLTTGEASSLNQVLAENIGNNLRVQIVEGQRDAEGNITGPHDEASVQALVNSYIADYEMGVRKAGTGPRIVDPVEREARKLARTAAIGFVKSQGLRQKDVEMAPIIAQIFATNEKIFMTEAKKVVAAQNKSVDNIEFEDVEIVEASAEGGEAEA